MTSASDALRRQRLPLSWSAHTGFRWLDELFTGRWDGENYNIWMGDVINLTYRCAARKAEVQ